MDLKSDPTTDPKSSSKKSLAEEKVNNTCKCRVHKYNRHYKKMDLLDNVCTFTCYQEMLDALEEEVLSKNISRVMQFFGLTQGTISILTGVSTSTISRMLSGKVKCSRDSVEKISVYLHWKLIDGGYPSPFPYRTMRSDKEPEDDDEEKEKKSNM